MKNDNDDEATAEPFLDREIIENPDGDAASLNRAGKKQMGKMIAERITFGTDQQRREIMRDILANDPDFKRSQKYRVKDIPLKNLTANGLLDRANKVDEAKLEKKKSNPAADNPLHELTAEGQLAVANGADPRFQPRRPRLKKF